MSLTTVSTSNALDIQNDAVNNGLQGQAIASTAGQIDSLRREQQPGSGTALTQQELEQRADALRDATNRWFPDKQGIYNALSNLSPEQGRQLEVFYLQQYGQSLEATLRSSLSTGNFERAMNKLHPQDMDRKAESLYRAMKGLGTDEDLVHATLENLTKDDAQALLLAFKLKYGEDLKVWLKGDLSGSDLSKALTALSIASEAEASKSLKDAIYGLGTDEETVHRVLKYIADSPPEFQQKVMGYYEGLTGSSLIDDLRGDLGSADFAKAISTLDPSPAAARAGKLYQAMYGMGTDEDGINNVLKGLSPRELWEVEQSFNQYFAQPWGDNLRVALGSELGTFHLNKSLALLNNGRDLTAEASGTEPVNTVLSQTPGAEATPEAEPAATQQPEPEAAPATEAGYDFITDTSPAAASPGITQPEIDLKLKIGVIKDPGLQSFLRVYEEARQDMNIAAVHRLKDQLSAMDPAIREKWFQAASQWKPKSDHQREFHIDFLTILKEPAKFNAENYTVTANGVTESQHKDAMKSFRPALAA